MLKHTVSLQRVALQLACNCSPRVIMPDRGMTTSFLRRKALEFDEADADGDQEVSLEEFVRFILPLTGERSESDLKEWFFLMDVDGDGLLSKD